MLEFLTFLVILVALFGREFIDYLKKPRLELHFDINNEDYFRKFPFTPDHLEIFNCLIKISNPRVTKLGFIKTPTATEVEAKITYVFQGDKKHIYHPTNLNWSGGQGIPFVSIISGSHYFLDFVKFVKDRELTIIEEGDQKEGKYFELWIPKHYEGILTKFTDDGEYRIHFVITGENCDSYKYVATLKWSKSKWDKPDIKIKKGG